MKKDNQLLPHSEQQAFNLTPEIITHVPSEKEMRRQYGRVLLHGHVEYTDIHLAFGAETQVNANDKNKIILNNLSNELNFGNPKNFSRTIRSLYSMSRNFGDRVIGDMSREAFTLLDSSRSYASMHQFVDSNNGYAYVYENDTDEGMAKAPTLYLNRGELFSDDRPGKKTLEKKLVASNVELQPGQLELLWALKLVSHEAGHVIQHGVGKINPTESSEDFTSYDEMSFRLMLLQPELKVTPNIYTSTLIHNERFAEGYSNIVLQQVAKTLGYDEEMTMRILRVFGYDKFFGPEFDYMSQVTEDVSMSDLALKHSIDLYDGHAGYFMPLSPNEVVRDLEVIGRDLKKSIGDEW